MAKTLTIDATTVRPALGERDIDAIALDVGPGDSRSKRHSRNHGSLSDEERLLCLALQEVIDLVCLIEESIVRQEFPKGTFFSQSTRRIPGGFDRNRCCLIEHLATEELSSILRLSGTTEVELETVVDRIRRGASTLSQRALGDTTVRATVIARERRHLHSDIAAAARLLLAGMDSDSLSEVLALADDTYQVPIQGNRMQLVDDTWTAHPIDWNNFVLFAASMARFWKDTKSTECQLHEHLHRIECIRCAVDETLVQAWILFRITSGLSPNDEWNNGRIDSRIGIASSRYARGRRDLETWLQATLSDHGMTKRDQRAVLLRFDEHLTLAEYARFEWYASESDHARLSNRLVGAGVPSDWSIQQANWEFMKETVGLCSEFDAWSELLAGEQESG